MHNYEILRCSVIVDVFVDIRNASLGMLLNLYIL
jgi:hypothetical protein